MFVYFIFGTVSQTAQLSTTDYVLLGMYVLVAASGLLMATSDLPHWLTVTDTNLVLYIGPFRSAVPIHSIRRIKRFDYGRGMLKMSQLRLELDYGKFGKAARATDEDAFIAALLSRNPAIEVVAASKASR